MDVQPARANLPLSYPLSLLPLYPPVYAYVYTYSRPFVHSLARELVLVSCVYVYVVRDHSTSGCNAALCIGVLLYQAVCDCRADARSEVSALLSSQQLLVRWYASLGTATTTLNVQQHCTAAVWLSRHRRPQQLSCTGAHWRTDRGVEQRCMAVCVAGHRTRRCGLVGIALPSPRAGSHLDRTRDLWSVRTGRTRRTTDQPAAQATAGLHGSDSSPLPARCTEGRRSRRDLLARSPPFSCDARDVASRRAY
ncbi:hypothetical protein OH77DRAFT_834303 [Trametes cingulata]|nr:hypothetical protein OH77DRAFT_834303 [Trametes cingulata]